MQLDINALIGHLFQSMPLWLPVVAVALHLNIPGITKTPKDGQ